MFSSTVKYNRYTSLGARTYLLILVDRTKAQKTRQKKRKTREKRLFRKKENLSPLAEPAY